MKTEDMKVVVADPRGKGFSPRMERALLMFKHHMEKMDLKAPEPYKPRKRKIEWYRFKPPVQVEDQSE